MLMKIAARVRGLFSGNYPENNEDEQLIMNNRGDLSVVQGLPELAELVRLGGSYQAQTATGLAALTALPTTTAAMSIYNGEPAGGKSYLIESFGSWEAVVDATQADTTALFAMLNAGTVAALSTGTVIVPGTGFRSMSGRKGYGGRAIVNGGATGTTVTNDGWFAHGAEAQAPLAPAAAGAIWKVNEARVRGLYLVPPGGQFNIQTVKVAAAVAQQFWFLRWHEVQLLVQP